MTSVLKGMVFKPSTIIFLVFGAALVALFVSENAVNPGYLLLALGSYTFETSAIVAAFAFLVFFMIFFWVFRIAEWSFSKSRGQNGARKKTTKGLIAYAEGNWSQAEKVLAKLC